MNMFTSIPVNKVKKTKFDLSHEKKLSIKMGGLYPVLYEEVMPGDSFKCNSEVFIRFAPLITPVMERFKASVHYFFVPNRIIWEDWEEFITGGEDGASVINHPKFIIDPNNGINFVKGRNPDYFGIPTTDNVTITNPVSISVLPFRAYLEIYNEYYRDQNLEPELFYQKTSDNVTSTAETQRLTSILTRSWSKDYFSAALPFAQRGADVVLPFSEIQYKAEAETNKFNATNITSNATGKLEFGTLGTGIIDNIESVGAPTINELRTAYRLQEWLENNARGGARYIEQIMSHFNVKSSDARLQRPEYLGGGSTNVIISETLNTSGVTGEGIEGNVQGNMAGNAVSIGKTNYFKRRFEEHGMIIGILSVLPAKATYWQGIDRMWTRFEKLDYPFPEFANLGEQEIANSEVYEDYTQTGGTGTFGYIPRYSEFKWSKSTIHGDFRDNLDYWHYAQKYANRPALNADFVKYNNDNRIWNVIDQSIDNLYVQIYHNISAIRPLPYYGKPKT